jgi:hypothetical protein
MPKKSKIMPKCRFLGVTSISNCAIQDDLDKMGDLRGFQIKQMRPFDTKNSFSLGKRRLKRKKIPEYRRINHYLKSTAQYWKERNRRKQVLKLSDEGHTLQQIAKEIGCSYRTVRRDAVKLRPYIKGQFNAHTAKLQKEARERLNRQLEGLSVRDMSKRFMAISQLMFKARKLSKKELEKQHNGIVFLDFDRLGLNGFPDLRLAELNGRFKTPYTFSFIAVQNGKSHYLGSLKIG